MFQHSSPDAGGAEDSLKELVLTKATEETDFLSRLRAFLDSVSQTPVPTLNFVIGDQRMYSKSELKRRIKLPVCLFTDLDAATAESLRARMAEQGFTVKVRDKHRAASTQRQRKVVGMTGGSVAAVTIGLAVVAPPVAAVAFGVMGAIGVLTTYLVMKSRTKKQARPGMLRLRDAPAALPASDPLVARLSDLLQADTPQDIREQLGELALVVQRVVDHRASLGEERAEAEMLTEPLEPIVSLIEDQVRRIADLDRELGALDEGAIVRALAASEARGEPRSSRTELLDGLDRLRSLEEQRARSMHGLLEAALLLRRAADLGLSVADPRAEHERQVQLALQALGGAGD